MKRVGLIHTDNLTDNRHILTQKFNLILNNLVNFDVPVTQIGIMEKGRGVRGIHPDGQIIDEVAVGYDHFQA